MREATHVIRELANCRSVDYKGSRLQFPWARTSSLEVWVAAYGPLALKTAGEVGDGYILQLADVDIARVDDHQRARGGGRTPAVTRTRSPSAWPPRTTSATTGRTCATSAAGSAGWSATTWPTSSPSTARAATIPAALTDYIKGRQGYDYNEHGRAGNTHTAFVPDEIVDRFCILGTAEDHIAKLEQLKDIGVDQFAGYLQHDNKEETLRVYGETIIPALREHVVAKA